MATYLGHGYLWHSEGLAADPIRAEWVRDVTVRYATLADFEEHMHDEYVQTEKGWTNYGWYQMQFAERGRDVFAKQGLEFIRRVRDELPWDRYAEWRTDELLQWLEKIEPGFITWARALERLRAAYGSSQPDVAESLYELGLLAHDRGSSADAESEGQPTRSFATHSR